MALIQSFCSEWKQSKVQIKNNILCVTHAHMNMALVTRKAGRNQPNPSEKATAPIFNLHLGWAGCCYPDANEWQNSPAAIASLAHVKGFGG